MTRGDEDTEARVYEDTEFLRQDTEVLRQDTDCEPFRFRTQIASSFAFGHRLRALSLLGFSDQRRAYIL